YRKQVMRNALHHDSTMLKVWLRIRNAPRAERYVLLDDLLLEMQTTRADTNAKYKNIAKGRRKKLFRLMKELDRDLSKKMPIRPKRWSRGSRGIGDRQYDEWDNPET